MFLISLGEVSLADAKNYQIRFKSNLRKNKKETTKINQKMKKNMQHNIEML